MNDKELKEQLKKEMLDLCETNSSVMTYMECLMRKYEILQSKIDKAIEILESQLPICIMPNNMLIHGTEKAKAIEETLDILKENK